MKLTRRAMLSTVGVTVGTALAGCSSLDWNRGRVDWSADVPGEYVAGTPVVDAGRVAVAAENSILYVFDAEEGELLGDDYGRGGGDFPGTPPIATDDGFVSATSSGLPDGSGELVLRSPTGERRWRRRLSKDGPVNSAVQPLLYEGSVYFDRNNTAGLFRFDVAARELKQIGDFYGPVESWDHSGSRAVVGTENWDLAAVDLDTGDELWRTDANMIPSPRWYEGDVLTQTYDNDDGVFVERFVPETEELRWRTGIPGITVEDVARLDGSTIAVSARFGTDEVRSGHVVFLDAESGERLGGHTFESSSLGYVGMAAAGERVVVTGNRDRGSQGVVSSLATDEDPKRIVALDGGVSSAPWVSGEKAIVGGQNPSAVYAVWLD